MKKVLILSLLVFCFTCVYSQKYIYGACFVNPNFFKLEGRIIISDTTIEISSNYNGVEKTSKYNVLKKINGITYITDGIMNHTVTLTSEKGKKKGFEYDNLIIIYFDKNQPGGIENMIYYSKIETN
jgi:hypothetical protein